MLKKKRGRISKLYFVIGILFGFIILIGFEKLVIKTSTNSFCESCHIHPHSTQTWKTSPHYDNKYGIYVNCVDCHLPPKTSLTHYSEKAITGMRDVWGKLFKDAEKLNWEEKSKLDHAVKHTFQASCIKCHQNLFPVGLSKKGEDAHLYYTQKEEEINCLNCHLRVGHYSHDEQKAETYKVEKKRDAIIYKHAAKLEQFENFAETVPGTSVKFDMIAIPGGRFKMGSPDSEPFRNEDEGPQVEIEISPFWIAKTEVTWNQYEAFYSATATEGRSDTRVESDLKVDGITGPTPPYENPDQGWGRGSRPAITMTFHTAQVYCEWLSQQTGKKYRLPTEAEWEYACRGGTDTPYFFEGDPKKFTAFRFINKIFGMDTTGINSYANYVVNSSGKTKEPEELKTNPFGLLNMAGNVWEFCSDWYSPTIYQSYQEGVKNPQGPDNGKEHVIRGGSYKSDAIELRSASRAFTEHDKWMVTDPQMPKSKWWYSDSKDVGFRVVCEYPEK